MTPLSEAQATELTSSITCLNELLVRFGASELPLHFSQQSPDDVPPPLIRMRIVFTSSRVVRSSVSAEQDRENPRQRFASRKKMLAEMETMQERCTFLVGSLEDLHLRNSDSTAQSLYFFMEQLTDLDAALCVTLVRTEETAEWWNRWSSTCRKLYDLASELGIDIDEDSAPGTACGGLT